MNQLREIEQSYHTGGISLMKSEMMSLLLRNIPSWCTLEEAVHVHCYTQKLLYDSALSRHHVYDSALSHVAGSFPGPA